MRKEDDLEVIRELKEKIQRLKPLPDEASQKQWRIKRGELAKAQFECFKKSKDECPLLAIEALWSSLEMGYKPAWLLFSQQDSKAYYNLPYNLPPLESLKKLDKNGLFQLGLGSYFGVGTLCNHSLAVQYIRLASAKGDPSAQFFLGVLFENGRGVRKDEAEALKLYRLAADQGNANAQFSLGAMHGNARGVPKDEVKAAKLYRLAADQGHADAQFNLGFMYANGQGVPKDEAEAVKLYRSAADQGDAVAQTTLGFLHENGQGVPKDGAEAVKLYRLAADQGYAVAQFNLGLRYAKGQGVRKDEAEAVKLFRLAADQGEAFAQYTLGIRYANGRGVPKDEAEAVKLFRLAGDQGDADAQTILAFRYAHGQGVPKDEAEAVKLFRLAADQGNALAQYNLGAMLSNGQGVRQDDAEARRFFQLAAEQGQANAIRVLKEWDQQGRGLSKNTAKPEPIKKPNPQNLLATLHRSETKTINAAFFKDALSVKSELLSLFVSTDEKEKDQIVNFLTQNILISGENWPDQYDVLALLSSCNLHLVTSHLEQCNVEIVKRSCRLINQSTHLGKAEEAAEFFARLESFMKKLEAHPDCLKHYQNSYHFAEKFIESHYIQKSETLLRQAKAGDKKALDDLETLAKDKKEARVLCGVYYEDQAALLVDKLNKKEIGDFWGSRRAEANALFQKSLQYYEEARKIGSAEAAYRCGLFFEKGLNSVVDFKKAIYFYSEAAAKNREAKTKLKEWSHQTEFPALAILANIYESLAQDLQGDPEYFYGSYYLSCAYDIKKDDKETFFECLHEIVNNEEYGLNIRLPLAQVMACKKDDKKMLYAILDALLISEKDPKVKMANHQIVNRYISAPALCDYALYKFDNDRLEENLRLILMGLAKEKAKETAYVHEEFEVKFLLIKSKIELLHAEGKILPPRPSAPPLSQESAVAEARAEAPKAAEKPVRKTYAERLETIKFDENKIPEKFLCDISKEIMDPPVISSNGMHWNQADFEKNKKINNGRNPLNTNEKLKDDAHVDLKLKNKIEAFIEKQEAEYKSRALPLSTASAQPSPEINLDPANKSQDDAEVETLHLESPKESPMAKFEGKTEVSKASPKASPKTSPKSSPNLSVNNAALFASPRSLARGAVDAMLDSLPPTPDHALKLTEDNKQETTSTEKRSQREIGQ